MIQRVPNLPSRPNPIVIDEFLGIDITGTDDLRRAVDLINCTLDDEGAPEMRTGHEILWDFGDGPILGVHEWSDSLVLVHHGVNLYTYDFENDPVLVYSAMGGATISESFTMQNKLVIFDGTTMVLYDGLVVVTAESQAYIPTFLITVPPTGGGVRLEDLNLLSPSWKEQFSTEAGVFVHQLHTTDLTSVDEVELNGVVLTVTTDYTVDLTAGTVTLVADPGATTDGLIVTATKTGITDSSRILNCTFAQVFGGPSDSRVFMSGNPDYPYIDWWTQIPFNGSYDPTYWPDTNFDKIGGDNSAILGYAVQYDTMVVLKQDSIFLRGWELVTDAYGRTVMRFPATILSDKEGCISPESVAIANNNPIWMSEFGMRELVASNVRDERNIEDISTLVDITVGSRLVAIDHDDKYYLAVGDGNVWVADYKRQVQDEETRQYKPVWFRWTDVPANVWYSSGDRLFFGATDGTLRRFKSKTDEFPFNDEGAAINCEYKMIFSDLGRTDLTKLVQSVNVQMKPWGRARIDMEYYTEKGPSEDIDIHTLNLIDFVDTDFADFSFDTSYVSKVYPIKITDARNIQIFRVVLRSSGEPDEFFGFNSVAIIFQNLSEVRRWV